MIKNNQIAIYKSISGKVGLKIKLRKDSIWLTQTQIAKLFEVNIPAVSKHIANIYDESELLQKRTVSKMETVQIEGKRKTKRKVDFYNLDMIISIGYRVNSVRATQFRIWATRTLKQYLVKGYVLNQKRLKEQQKNLKILSDSVAMIKSKIALPLMVGQETELFEIVKTYIDSLRILKLYDDQELTTKKLKTPVKYSLEYIETTKNINELKQNLVKQKLASDNFGLENDQALRGLIGAISQTFDGKELYRSIEEKAANLLYFVIKDHPFVDGNKRIGSTLFIYFLSKNNYLFKTNGESKINDRALVALALLVAVSNPQEKDIIVKLIINLIRD